MDLTPRLLTEVEFREEWRGYKREDVDEFLAGVAGAVAELQEALRVATERATLAEQRLLERGDEDEIRRTLVLAQRTAAAAVEEARVEAARIVEEANQRAREQIAEAEARLSAVEVQVAERTRVELGSLAERRAALQADVDALAAFEAEHRARLRDELQRQLAALDAPTPGTEALTVPEPPAVSDVDASVPESVELADVVEPLEDADVPEAQPPSDDEVQQAREELAEALRRAGTVPDDDVPADALDELPRPQLFDDDEVDAPGEPTGQFDVIGDLADGPEGDLQWRDAGPDAEGGDGVDDDVEVEQVSASADDPFLAELRRAVTDTAPLGPRDEEEPPFSLHPQEDEVPAGRFRLRRTR